MMDGTRFGGDDFFPGGWTDPLSSVVYLPTDYFVLFKKDVFLTFYRGKSPFFTTI